MTASVNSSQPCPSWLLGCPSRTVSTAFSSSTPCRAQGTSEPLPGGGTPMSLASSLKMFTSERGGGTPGCTENASPCACPGPWYGSCPSSSTRTRSYGVSRNAEKRSASEG